MWLMLFRTGPAAIFLVLLLAAAAPVRAADGSGASIFVVAHHWHTGIAVPVADVPAERWPAASVFAGADLVEVCCGARDFWMSRQEATGRAVKAAGAWEASVVRVLWFDGPVEQALPASDIVELSVPRTGLAALVDFVSDTYTRTAAGEPIDLGPAGWPRSRFYLATGRYHLFNTSNRWTPQALIRAGLPFSAGSLTARSIICRAAALGRVVRLREPCESSPPPGCEGP